MQRTSTSFISRYLERVRKTRSVLCVGLDPTLEHVPPALRDGNPVSDIDCYLRIIIDMAAPLVPVIKTQFAYYAALGLEGLLMLERLIAYARAKGFLVIMDAKRADIGETMQQYGKEVFCHYHADACTFVPYLGSTFNPSWMEWLKQGKMVISMIRTSNPEAVELQDCVLKDGLKVYEHLAWLVGRWNAKVFEKTQGAGSVGGVVGATWPEQAKRCREFAGNDVFFLIPGYGAQGGGAEGAVISLRSNRKQLMGTVNSSRNITLFSWWDKAKKEPRKGDPLELVKRAIETANVELNAALLGK
jgi:orotidine-5'-phosphate decarboxylase